MRTETNEIYTTDENGNTVLISSEVVQVPDLPPDWLGLEQAVVYSPLFMTIANSPTRSDFWWGVLQTTIQNGKRGQASETFLSIALSNIGVVWTTQEKTELNSLLTANNFTIQVT